MIERELYSPKAFLNILSHNGIDCEFEKCTLFKDYVTYQFEMKQDAPLTEFQLYSVTFSVIIESENSCYFIGKNGKKLVFLLTFTNDLKKFGLKKTPDKQGVVPKETLSFDYVKSPLAHMVWYKFETKELALARPLKQWTEGVTNAEDRVILDQFWKEITEG